MWGGWRGQGQEQGEQEEYVGKWRKKWPVRAGAETPKTGKQDGQELGEATASNMAGHLPEGMGREGHLLSGAYGVVGVETQWGWEPEERPSLQAATQAKINRWCLARTPPVVHRGLDPCQHPHFAGPLRGTLRA